MSQVATQILQRFSPFENHASINIKNIKNVINDMPDNNFNIQDKVFQIISSDNSNKLLFNITLLLIKNYKNLDFENQSVLRFIIFCKNLSRNIENNYTGYNTNFKKIITTDILKLISKEPFTKYILAQIKGNDKLRKIILKSLSKLFKYDNSINIKFKEHIIYNYIQSLNLEEFSKIDLVNTEKKIVPFIEDENEIFLIKYMYFENYIEYCFKNDCKYINYDFILSTFGDLIINPNYSIMHIQKYNYLNLIKKILTRSFNNVNYISDNFCNEI